MAEENLGARERISEDHKREELPQKRNDKKRARRPSIHTLKSDSSELLQKSKTSIFDIAARAEKRRQKKKQAKSASLQQSSRARFVIITVIVLLAITAGGLSYYFFITTRPPAEPPAPNVPPAFARADETTVLNVRADDQTGLLEAVTRARSDHLASRQIRYLPVQIEQFGAPPAFASAREFFTLSQIVPPENFMASLSDRWNLHIYYTLDVPELALLFEIKNPNRALRGLLSWEGRLSHDFAALAGKKTAPIGTTTPAYKYKDIIIENVDARVRTNLTSGKTSHSYAIFAGRLAIIATSKEALKSILNRLITGPVNF